MSTSLVLRLLPAAALLAASVLAAPPVHAQEQNGIIQGRVTDAANGQALVAAQVQVLGTTLGAQTNQQGEFTVRAVPAGAQRVRVIRVGYSEAVQPVTVTPGATATVNVQMRAVAITLTPVVTTATGEQRRVEVGNAIGNVQAAEITQTQAIRSVGDLLTARTPGVQVLGGGMTGAGSRVRIRGTSSLSLSNEPIYIIDGVRMESATNSTSIGVGGTTPSRVGDLNPDEIESIDIVRGPSAATLYGTDAASGVIVITTKRGRAGPPQWTAYVEQGLVYDNNKWPTSYYQYGRNAAGSTIGCFNYLLATGGCVAADSARSFNPTEVDSVSPLGRGNRAQYGMQVRGGSEAVRYFVAGEWEQENGLLEMPSAGRNRLVGANVAIRDEWERPNALRRASGRANLDIRLSEKADVNVSTNYIALNQRFPQSDNNINAWGPTLFGANARTQAYGYFDPADSFQETVTQDIDRFIGQVGGNLRPLAWLTLRGNFGLDYTSRVDSDLCRFDECAPFGTNREGFKFDNRTNFYQYTADVASTGTFQITPTLNSRTAVGVQFFRSVFDRNGASGTQLPPGATQVTAGSVKGASEATDDSRTLGAFIEETLSWQDKLYLTGALRTDRNSAFGRDFAAVYYPKFAVSYVISNDSWFPTPTWMNELRLRSAYGASGRQPGPTDAAAFYTTIVNRLAAAEAPGLTLSTLGNPALRPERATELEAGIDGTMWDNRVTAELTYYNKRSKDALINRVLPPSIGTGATARLENLGEVRNSGIEWLLNVQAVQTPNFGWDFTINGSRNQNELVSLGNVPPIIGTTIRQIEGYPLNGYWQRPLLGYNDTNNDGRISSDELTIGDSAIFRGYSQPRMEISVVNGVDLWNRRIRLQAMVDYKGGHLLYNNTERFRCVDAANCAGIYDPNASLFEQARAVAARVHPARTLDGYIEDASFLRLREVSLSFQAPSEWASRYLRGRDASVVLAARNLGVRTDYTGLDPESNYGQDNVPADFLTQPPPSYLTLRFNFGF